MDTVSPPLPAPVPATVEATRWIAAASLLALIALCLAWELVLAPAGPAAALFAAAKAFPLCFAVAGVLKRRMYTYRWLSLLVWAYVMEGAVRVFDGGTVRALAAAEIALAAVLFAACVMHVRLRLRANR